MKNIGEEQIREYMDTTLVVVEKEISTPCFYVVPLADFHIGSKAFAMDVARGYIDWIKERDNAYTILNGDMMNCAVKSSVSELYEDLIRPDDAYKIVRELLMPIKDKVLMVTRGNHEGNIYKSVGVDFTARLAYDLGDVPYRPNGGMVIVYTPRNIGNTTRTRVAFRFYATHGWGGARTIGAKVKKVEELVMAVDADVYILSHDHTQNVRRINQKVPSGRHDRNGVMKLIPHRKLLVNTGGFLEYADYLPRHGLQPQDLGTPRIRCEVKEKGRLYYKDLHASI